MLLMLAALATATLTGLGARQAPVPFDVLITGGRIVDGTGRAVVRRPTSRSPAIASRPIGQLAGQPARRTDRRHRACRRAGVHRHARAVGVQRPGRRPRRVEDHAGRHDRDHRRGRLDRAGQRPDDRPTRPAELRPLQGRAGLHDARRVLRRGSRRGAGRRSTSARSSGAGGVRDYVIGRTNVPATPADAGADEGARRRGDGRTARSGSARRCSTCPTGSPRPTSSSSWRRWPASYGGVYLTHQRSESGAIDESLDEVFAIAERANIPAEIWHLKTAYKANWGRMPEVLQRIEEARARGLDVTANQYPYTRASNDLDACLPLVGARGRQRPDDRAAQGSDAPRAHQARDGRPARHGLGEPVVRGRRRRRRHGGLRAEPRPAQVRGHDADAKSARRWARTRATR